VPDAYFPRPSANMGEGYHGMSENVREQVASTLREFGLEPKGRARTYHKPYPEFFLTWCLILGVLGCRISLSSLGRIPKLLMSM
jgi:hypothetical protein